MDHAQTRRVVEAHAQAVVDPIDVAHIRSDMIEELHPAIPQIANMLPQPVTEATVEALEIEDGQALATIRYAGAGTSLVIKSRWEDRGAGQPQIVSADPEA